MDHPAVLIIDDEPALARNLAAYLRRVGYEVRTAGSAEDGLAALAQFRPAVVVCDHDLPGMSGLDAVRRLRGSDGDTPVVMVSGRDGVAGPALAAGAAHFLAKPLALADVRGLLERLIGH